MDPYWGMFLQWFLPRLVVVLAVIAGAAYLGSRFL